MKTFRFLRGYSLIGILAAAVSWTAHAFSRAAEAVVEFVAAAFPPSERLEFAFAVATAPRVIGLHETRAFHQRLAQPSGRRRAPMSQAFAAQA